MRIKVETGKAAAALRRLGEKARRRAVTRSVRAGAKPVVEAARRGAPRDSGALAKSIKITSVKTDRTRGAATAVVGSKGTKSLGRRFGGSRFYSSGGGKTRYGAARYFHLVVKGTKPHRIRGPMVIRGRVVAGVDHPGSRPNPFMQRAARSAFRPAVDAFVRDFGPNVEAEARREANA